MRSQLQRTAERMVFFGLRTHCVCFRCPYRFRHDDIMNLEKPYDDWDVKSLNAFSQLRGYDKDNRGIPKLIFNTVFDSEVEPMQKKLGLGWWRRMKNRSKFRNLFESGILLGILYDMKSNELATQEAGQPTVSPPANAVSLARTRILVVSDEEVGNKAYSEWLCRNGYDAVGCDVIRGGKWRVKEALEDATAFQPHVALLFHNLRFTKEMTGLDLALLLFECLPNTRFIVGRLGDSYCVSEETLQEARSRGYKFQTFVIAPERETLLEMLDGQKVSSD
jgi:CheY-like chemotaxis protein